MNLDRWIRQPTTLHGLGVIAGGIGAVLSQEVTGNKTWDLVIAVVAYALVHLGINDHSVAQSAVEELTLGALGKAQLSPGQALTDVAQAGEALAPADAKP